jgi:hypothetical protein
LVKFTHRLPGTLKFPDFAIPFAEGLQFNEFQWREERRGEGKREGKKGGGNGSEQFKKHPAIDDHVCFVCCEGPSL